MRKGWLAASPETKGSKKTPPPRRVKLEKSGISMDPGDWGVDMAHSGGMLSLMNRLGWCGHGMAGPVPQSWSEIIAFRQAIGVDLTPCEMETLSRMSEGFCEGYHSDDPTDPALWDKFRGALIPFVPIDKDPVPLVEELRADPPPAGDDDD